jgi:hypothetical protein
MSIEKWHIKNVKVDSAYLTISSSAHQKSRISLIDSQLDTRTHDQMLEYNFFHK